MKQLFSHITIDPNIQFGKPVIEGTRTPVDVVIGHLAAGMTIEEIIKEYRLTREQILAALQYAAYIVADESVSVTA